MTYRLVDINEWFDSDYVNMTCELPDPDETIPSHPTRQAVAVMVNREGGWAAVCRPHAERLVP